MSNAAAVNPKSQTTAFILNLFLGFLGVHKFYLGKVGLGILYFLTGGLFLIGWTIDTIALAFMSKEVFAAKYNNGVPSKRIGAWARILVLLPLISIGLGVAILIGGIGKGSDKVGTSTIFTVGQTITESKFSFTVNDAKTLDSIEGQRPPQGAVYVALLYTYENLTGKPISAFGAPEVYLHDSKNVEYNKTLDASVLCSAAIDSNAKAVSDINPGIKFKDCSIFEVSEKLFDRNTWRIKVSGIGRTSWVSLAQNQNAKQVEPAQAPPSKEPAADFIVAKLVDSNQGDTGCGLRLAKSSGEEFDASGAFDMCEDKYAKGQTYKFKYGVMEMPSGECQGAADCKKTEKQKVIVSGEKQ